MIIDLQIGNEKDKMKDGFIEVNSIYAMEKIDDETCFVHLYGGERLFIKLAPDELREQLKIAKQSDRFGYVQPNKNNKRIFKEVEVGQSKFRLDIHESEYDGEINRSLWLMTNFLVKNAALETMVEHVLGVEKMSDFSFNKYETSIHIAKMFDAETVRDAVEKKIVDYLTE